MADGDLKNLFVGKHRKACRSRLLVFADDPTRVEVLANNPGRRRGLFDLGDQADVASGGLAQRAAEIPPGAMLPHCRLQVSGGDGLLAKLRDLQFLLRNDGFEDVHQPIPLHPARPTSAWWDIPPAASPSRTRPDRRP